MGFVGFVRFWFGLGLESGSLVFGLWLVEIVVGRQWIIVARDGQEFEGR